MLLPCSWQHALTPATVTMQRRASVSLHPIILTTDTAQLGTRARWRAACVAWPRTDSPPPPPPPKRPCTGHVKSWRPWWPVEEHRGCHADDATALQVGTNTEMYDAIGLQCEGLPEWMYSAAPACQTPCFLAPSKYVDGRSDVAAPPLLAMPHAPPPAPETAVAMPETRLPAAACVSFPLLITPAHGSRAAIRITERAPTCMLTAPGYPITATVVATRMRRAARLPSAFVIPVFQPGAERDPKVVPHVCAQGAPGHLERMHLSPSLLGPGGGFRLPHAMPYDVQASRTTAVVNFGITLDSGGAMPSAFESSATAAALFGAPLPTGDTTFAAAVTDIASSFELLPMSQSAETDAEAESRERVAGAFETVISAIGPQFLFTPPTGNAAGPG